MADITRRFSLEDDFMNYGTDDLLYGFMRSISTSKENVAKGIKSEGKQLEKESRTEYLTIKNFQKNRKVIAGICGCTSQTINNRLDKLIARGLVDEQEIAVEENGKMYVYPSYTFPYDYDGRYKIIDKDMLSYLINTRNAHVIRIYLYLLNASYKPDYVFTLRELKKILGYAETTKTAEGVIGDILTSLQKEGIIKFKKAFFEEVDDCGHVIPVERMVLKFVAKHRNEF